jgi:hypothetical protein
MGQIFVTQTTSGEPIAGAHLSGKNAELGDWQAVTDERGEFTANLGDATYQVTATKDGFTPITMDVIVGPAIFVLQAGSGPTPPTPTPPHGDDAFDLASAIVASADCPQVAGLPIRSSMSEITLTDVGDEGQGFAMNFPGRDTWPQVVPPGWEGGINHTLWIAELIGGQWFILPIKEGLHDYCTVGPILYPGQIPENLTYFAQSPMYGYQPRPGEQIGFFATTGDTRRMNLQPLGAGRTNVVLVPFSAGHYTW